MTLFAWIRGATAPEPDALTTTYAEALEERRAAYREMRAATLRCFYAVEKMEGRTTRYQASADRARDLARGSLERGDTAGSRRAVGTARTLVDLARESASHLDELRAARDRAARELLKLAEELARLEHENLRAIALTPLRVHSESSALTRARRLLEEREAERELEMELA